MPLVTLLNRLMERMNGLIQHNQLWTKVHCESNLVIGGDIEKIELILSELMIHACERAPAGGRLDIWARPLDQQWLELSITHNGVVDPQLIEALKPQPEADLLASSILYQPPGLNLRISQLLMAHLGGEFKLEQLEDQRMLSRLILPLSKAAEHLPKLAANALTYSSDNPEPAV
jgi:signal transduction histidine kinase